MKISVWSMICLMILTSGLVACGGGSAGGATTVGNAGTLDSSNDDNGANDDDVDDPPVDQPGDQPGDNPGEIMDPIVDSELDTALREKIVELDLTGDPSIGRNLPDINDPLPQLGMKLFYSKSLGGELDSACVTCHHPKLGGSDNLALPVGVEAVDPDLLGLGREHIDALPLVPRNSPSTYNVGMWDRGLFHDSRVESLDPIDGVNGELGAISTPDSGFNVADINAGDNLTAAQARFPVTSPEEMKTARFLPDADNQEVRDRLASRIGGYGEGAGELSSNEWLQEFQQAFASTAQASTLITFDNIAHAIGEYERSQVFVDTPWRDYVQGDNTAISEQAKRGAILFYTEANQGGGGCFRCHSGDFFTDERHHVVGFPQIGPGKGHGPNGDDDFGREGVTGDADDRYQFRTPSLLNVALTAPYTHSGAYQTLQEVLDHYDNAENAVERYFDRGGWCQQPQFSSIDQCETLYPNAGLNTQLALEKGAADRRDAQRPGGQPPLPPLNVGLNQGERRDLIAFLNTLTDRCIVDDECISSWIPERNGGPDGNQLNAIDGLGGEL